MDCPLPLLPCRVMKQACGSEEKRNSIHIFHHMFTQRTTQQQHHTPIGAQSKKSQTTKFQFALPGISILYYCATVVVQVSFTILCIILYTHYIHTLHVCISVSISSVISKLATTAIHSSVSISSVISKLATTA